MKAGQVLAQLGENDLRSLAGAIRTGRICPPFTIPSLARIVGPSMAGPVTSALDSMADKGCNVEALALALEMLGDASSVTSPIDDSVHLVMTGPIQSEAHHRDTKVVVTDLFRRADRSVLIAGYAVHQGKSIFRELAIRMDAIPSLNVRLFLNLTSEPRAVMEAKELESRFVREFSNSHWPTGYRLPEVFYDRRSINSSNNEVTSLHAKCVVIDERQLFISSANFTEAAQNRNIEMGVLMNSQLLATQATNFFTALIRDKVCLRLI